MHHALADADVPWQCHDLLCLGLEGGMGGGDVGREKGGWTYRPRHALRCCKLAATTQGSILKALVFQEIGNRFHFLSIAYGV